MSSQEPQIELFSEDDCPKTAPLGFNISLKPLKKPIWTEHKANLIARYLYYFVLITKHGTYIDGFSGPQESDKHEMWAAKLVIESYPRWLRNFFLCELDSSKIEAIQAMWDSQPVRNKKRSEPKRNIEIFDGDFNTEIAKILPKISEKEATFCLLDQRTFECQWSTVEAIAAHKMENHKIELFYFLPIKWLQRAMAAQQDHSPIDKWWGKNDWNSLRSANRDAIKDAFCDRFKALGYKSVLPWPIWEREDGAGSIMYYMIHATDHPSAPGLMSRAYRTAVTDKEPYEQLALEFEALVSN